MRNIDSLFTALGQHLQMDNVQLNSQGTFTLLSNNLPVSFHYFDDDEMLQIYTPLGFIPEEEEPRVKVERFFLYENSFFRGTAGGAIGVHQDGAAWYGLSLDVANMDSVRFINHVLSMLHAATNLRDKLSKLFDSENFAQSEQNSSNSAKNSSAETMLTNNMLMI